MIKERIAAIVITGLVFASCNTGSNSNATPDSLGWTNERVNELKNECLWRYKKKPPAGEVIDRNAYCDCFVNKITISVSHEKHQAPTEETVKQIEQFSAACEALNKKDKGSNP